MKWFLVPVLFLAVALIVGWTLWRSRALGGVEEVVPVAGGLYSVEDEGSYRIVKVLAFDDQAVHLRLYKNTFPQRPASVDPATLTLGTIHDPDGFGVGHMPLARPGFSLWKPVYLASVPVTEEELEGYRMWQEGARR